MKTSIHFFTACLIILFLNFSASAQATLTLDQINAQLDSIENTGGQLLEEAAWTIGFSPTLSEIKQKLARSSTESFRIQLKHTLFLWEDLQDLSPQEVLNQINKKVGNSASKDKLLIVVDLSNKRFAFSSDLSYISQDAIQGVLAEGIQADGKSPVWMIIFSNLIEKYNDAKINYSKKQRAEADKIAKESKKNQLTDREIERKVANEMNLTILYWVLATWLTLSTVIALTMLVFLFQASQVPKDKPYKAYQKLSPIYNRWLLFLFPLPYVIVWMILNKKVQYYRNVPRVSAKTGDPMHKLDDNTKMKQLSTGQCKEEDLNAYDYDVWVTEDGEVETLAYKTLSPYTHCFRCNFKTKLSRWYFWKSKTVRTCHFCGNETVEYHRNYHTHSDDDF